MFGAQADAQVVRGCVLMRASSEGNPGDSVSPPERVNVTSIADLDRYQGPNSVLPDDLAPAGGIILMAMLSVLIWAALGTLVWLFW